MGNAIVKYLLIICAALMGSVRVQAQLLMNAGDSFTYHFDSIPQYAYQIPCCFFFPGAVLQLTLADGSFAAGDSLRMEIFEGTTAEPAASQLTLNGTGTPWLNSLHSWEDHEGALRVTALSGSFVVNDITIQRNAQYLSGNVDVYQIRITPVPEPSTCLVFIIGVVMGSACSLRRKAPKTSTTSARCSV